MNLVLKENQKHLFNILWKDLNLNNKTTVRFQPGFGVTTIILQILDDLDYFSFGGECKFVIICHTNMRVIEYKENMKKYFLDENYFSVELSRKFNRKQNQKQKEQKEQRKETLSEGHEEPKEQEQEKQEEEQEQEQEQNTFYVFDLHVKIPEEIDKNYIKVDSELGVHSPIDLKERIFQVSEHFNKYLESGQKQKSVRFNYLINKYLDLNEEINEYFNNESFDYIVKLKKYEEEAGKIKKELNLMLGGPYFG